MRDFEIKECLAECLTELEDSIELLEEVKDQDAEINNCYDELCTILDKLLKIYGG